MAAPEHIICPYRRNALMNAEQRRRMFSQGRAAGILNTLIGYLHVDDAAVMEKPNITIPAESLSCRPVQIVSLSADIPRDLFDSITNWDADGDPDVDGLNSEDREPDHHET